MKMNFSKNFAVLRRTKGITQETMAEKCGVSRQAVTKWECGSSLPDLYKVSEIADIFDIKVDELLHGKLEDNSIGQSEFDSKADCILEEIRKLKEDVNNINMRSDVYNRDLVLADEDEGIPAYALRSLGINAAENGNYDNAIDFLEEALVRGDSEAFSILISIHKEILNHFLREQDDYTYLEEYLGFSRRVQEYGKVMELAIKRRLELFI